MDARLDAPFDSWGGFSERMQGSPIIHGRLRYDPDEGIELDLVENPRGIEQITAEPALEPDTIYGQLVDGTRVTLTGCFVRRGSIQLGIGIGSPTTLAVNRALFGDHVTNLDQLIIKRYAIELTSLANWIGGPPVTWNIPKADGKFKGLDVTYRPPAPIHVEFPEARFDLRISPGMATQSKDCTFTIAWRAYVAVGARESMTLPDANQVAWQFQSLMSLLIGHQLSVKSIAITPADPRAQDAEESSLQLVYEQRGRHDCRDVHAAHMLLPYASVKGEFDEIVRAWFLRSDQAVLASNVFFGSQYVESAPADVRFLAVMQAAESYHRSLGSGIYMNQGDYDAAITEFMSHMPAVIEGDHRQSLKSRLRYGNEHSLRKRLVGLLDRIPEDVRSGVAGDVTKFVAKLADTRNYHTHYDHDAQANLFDGVDMLVATERLRILIVANLLHDLGIKDENLLDVLKRSKEFQHWMRQKLPL